MQKRLILLRHAKTERADAETDDRARKLTDRGRADAPVMAAWLVAIAGMPDLVLCSTAARTRETWELVSPTMPNVPVSLRDDLYLAEADELLEILRLLPDGASTVLLIGHNSGLEDLANELVGSGNPDEIAAMAAKFPTSGVAVISFDTEKWSAIDAGEGRLLHFMTPRRLAAG